VNATARTPCTGQNQNGGQSGDSLHLSEDHANSPSERAFCLPHRLTILLPNMDTKSGGTASTADAGPANAAANNQPSSVPAPKAVSEAVSSIANAAQAGAQSGSNPGVSLLPNVIPAAPVLVDIPVVGMPLQSVLRTIPFFSCY